MLRDLRAKLKSYILLIPQTFTATVATTGVNVADFGSLMFNVAVGAFSFTGTDKISIVMQDSNDNSTWANCTSADIYDAEDGDNGVAKILDASGDASSVHSVYYRGNKKYARLNLVEAGTVSVTISVVGVAGHPELQPPL